MYYSGKNVDDWSEERNSTAAGGGRRVQAAVAGRLGILELLT
ncbi:MAG: hypothetical protein N3H84_01565 [Candidatus Caldarchaeum sp.]|nr:hypothetical protein [Candidatus Caldarchaeum sp.]MCX8200778.1 hypothetical protein [Candidatus Caldarchaeum sp.]MDW8435367.1 hypothetical protein [Candidatus Caldarchaeum sp.]